MMAPAATFKLPTHNLIPSTHHRLEGRFNQKARETRVNIFSIYTFRSQNILAVFICENAIEFAR
jgi:hypothetical protein